MWVVTPPACPRRRPSFGSRGRPGPAASVPRRALSSLRQRQAGPLPFCLVGEFCSKEEEKNGLGESRGVEIKKDFCFKTGKISMQQVAEGKNWWSGERSRSFWNTVTGWEGLGFCARRPHVSSGLPGWAVGSVFPGVGTRVVLSLENFKAVTTFKCWPAFLLFHVPEPESLILNSISDKNVACGRPGGSVD